MRQDSFRSGYRFIWMKRDKNKRKRGRKISSIFLAPSILGVLVFFVLPFFVVIFYSFLDILINHQFVFLDNFKMVFKEKNCEMYKCTYQIKQGELELRHIFSNFANIVEWEAWYRNVLKQYFLWSCCQNGLDICCWRCCIHASYWWKSAVIQRDFIYTICKIWKLTDHCGDRT